LATGDEFGNPVKLKVLLNEHSVPQPIVSRETVRLEAENFLTLDGFELEYHNDRQVSHRINVRVNANNASRMSKASISTPFFEPNSSDDARYDISIRFAAKTDVRFQLLMEGRPHGAPWSAATKDETWETRTIHDVPLRRGDEIAVSVGGNDVAGSRLDYIELTLLRSDDNTAAQLDEPYRPFFIQGPLRWNRRESVLVVTGPAPSAVSLRSAATKTPLHWVPVGHMSRSWSHGFESIGSGPRFLFALNSLRRG
jgi:hypothetical protein